MAESDAASTTSCNLCSQQQGCLVEGDSSILQKAARRAPCGPPKPKRQKTQQSCNSQMGCSKGLKKKGCHATAHKQITAAAEESESLQDILQDASVQLGLINRQVQLLKQHYVVRKIEGLALQQNIASLRPMNESPPSPFPPQDAAASPHVPPVPRSA